MIDTAARCKALELAKKFAQKELHASEFENDWPRSTQDLGVRSVGFWIWTLFDDDEKGLVSDQGDPEVPKILANSISFLESDQEFLPRAKGFLERTRDRFSYGVEWIDCELPWHIAWPMPASQDQKKQM